MIINRHNYEEYFLLYVDDELDEAERNAVEMFVEQNADVAKEFEMLKQTTLPLDELEFVQKDSLYKKETGISLSNYQEYFLLFIDNELNESEIESVEKFILKHPNLQEEFTLIKQTKLQPEAVEFDNKQVLYRKERKERRVIAIGLMRMSAAAAFIGLLATGWFLYPKATLLNNGFVKGNTGIRKSSPVNTLKNPPAVTKPTIETLQNKEEKSIAQTQPKREQTVYASSRTLKTISKKVASKQDEEKNVADNTVAVVETPKLKDDGVLPVKDPVAKNINDYNELNAANNYNAKVTAVANINPKNDKPLATNAVYREVDNEEENNTLFIGAAEINKNKLKGLLKKAVNFLERKLPKDESERTVEIASFQIKSK